MAFVLNADSDESTVISWLIHSGFDEAVIQTLKGYNGSDLLDLSKQDTKDLLGVSEGIRLFNRLHKNNNVNNYGNNNDGIDNENENDGNGGSANGSTASASALPLSGSALPSSGQQAEVQGQGQGQLEGQGISEGSVGAQENLSFVSVHPMLLKMSQGCIFSRYHPDRPLPSEHFFWYSRSSLSSLGSIHWCSPNEKNLQPRPFDHHTTLEVDLLTDIYLGKEPHIFESPSAAVAEDSRCFSLVSHSLVLNLETQDLEEEMVGIWLTGLQFVLETTGSNVILETDQNQNFTQVEDSNNNNNSNNNNETDNNNDNNNCISSSNCNVNNLNVVNTPPSSELSASLAVALNINTNSNANNNSTHNPSNSTQINQASTNKVDPQVQNHKRTITLAGNAAVSASLASRHSIIHTLHNHPNHENNTSVHKTSLNESGNVVSGASPNSSVRLTIVGGVGPSAAPLGPLGPGGAVNVNSFQNSNTSSPTMRPLPLTATSLSSSGSNSPISSNSNSSLINTYMGVRSQSISSYYKAGFLIKLGATVKNWKKRYFKISGDKLEYYSGEKQPFKLVGAIPMHGAKVIIIPNETYGKNSLFGITPLSSSRTYILDAQSIAERTEWISCLQSLITALRIKDQHSRQIMKMGCLKKLGHHVQSWQQRQFVLYSSGLMEYYDAPTVSTSSSNNSNNGPALSLSTAKLTGSFYVGGGTLNLNISPPSADHQHCFSIQPLHSDRVYMLSTTSAADKQSWGAAITPLLALLSESDSSTICEGILWKMGGVLNTRWQDRFFTLSKNKLKYFKLINAQTPGQSGDTKALGSIIIDPSTRIQRENEMNGKEFVFSIKPNNNSSRKYILAGGTERDRDRWICAIEEMIEESSCDCARVDGVGVWADQNNLNDD